LRLAAGAPGIDPKALERLERLGLARLASSPGGRELTLTPRGRLLGDAVTADLLA